MSLKRIAQEVLDLIEEGSYVADGVSVRINEAVNKSIESTRVFTPEELVSLRENVPRGGAPDVEVVEGTTQQVARAMATKGPVALLNFASARNPGGGFLNGAKAQEEDLCRCSALFPAINKQEEYYRANRAQASLLYTDYMIFSPDVPFFKVKGTGGLLSKPFESSVITAPAPNSKPYLRKSGESNLLEECFQRRWRNVLALAQAQRVPSILLGAWGCGAFGGDPVMASRTARNAIEEFGAAFEKIVFAIPGTGKQSNYNLQVFSECFHGRV